MNCRLIILFQESLEDRYRRESQRVYSRPYASSFFFQIWVLIMNINVSAFHILDSLANNSSASAEGDRLQTILLKHFEDETFVEGRVTANLAHARSPY